MEIAHSRYILKNYHTISEINMNTLEIEKILSKNATTRRHYLGCFAADEIPVFIAGAKHLQCIVVNTDPSYAQGAHWVALVCDHPSKRVIEYYDSLGIWPPCSLHIQKYFEQHCSRVRFNSIPLQSPYARSCGRHVIYFLFQRCQQKDFDTIIATLSSSKKPDRIVNEYIHNKIYINNA